MKRHDNKISRRSFLGYTGSTSLIGLSHSPVVALFSTILGGMSQKAWAQSLGLQPKTFVQILEGGGPSRWMFDNFLTPYSSEGFDKNPMVGTQFKNVNGRYIGVEYATENRHGIQVPTMWTHTIPTPGGGTRPMSDLLLNLLCIQGIETKNAGHESSQEWHWLPPGSAQSSSAFSADASNAPLAALNVDSSSYRFLSKESKSSLKVSTNGNMILNLLDPFKKTGSAQFQTNLSSLKSAYDSLSPALDELARRGHPGAQAISQNRVGALSLMETNFNNLAGEWTALVSKYQTLISSAIYAPNQLTGINDRPIGENGSGDPKLYQLDGSDGFNFHTYTDMRAAVIPETNVAGLAERFAFTEYVIKNNLSSSISFSIGGINTFLRMSDQAKTGAMGNDQHFTGLYPQTLFNLLRHRATATCLLELITQLKASNLFNNTIISLSGEFNRDPQLEMTGSDHGWQGKSIALYSGSFNGPLIIGNLRNDGRKGWGAGGTIPELGRKINLVDQAVTMAHLVGVPPPFTSANPVVTLGSNGLVSNIGKTRFVTA